MIDFPSALNFSLIGSFFESSPPTFINARVAKQGVAKGWMRKDWRWKWHATNPTSSTFDSRPFFNQPSKEVLVDNTGDQQIVPGISITSTGQASVAPSLAAVLFDLAIKLEEPTNLPVDVEHVLAGVVLAVRSGELDPNTPLSSDDPVLAEVLVGHVKTIFERFGGKVGEDD